MLILGVLIPATALLLMTGGLVGSGTLSILPILLWGYAGAILGDALSFWIGKWLGPSVLRWRILKRHRTTVARAPLLLSVRVPGRAGRKISRADAQYGANRCRRHGHARLAVSGRQRSFGDRLGSRPSGARFSRGAQSGCSNAVAARHGVWHWGALRCDRPRHSGRNFPQKEAARSPQSRKPNPQDNQFTKIRARQA